ncbi:MAG TPA: hypothetical protein VIV58_16445, partial [Kofleriaceae bacterium]
SIRAAFEAASARPEPWTASAYDLVLTDKRDRRPKFATLAIMREVSVPSAHSDQLVRWLSTDAGYTNGEYACCPVAEPPNALGIRLTRGSVMLDFVIQCGQVALGRPPSFDNATQTETGTLSKALVSFLESLHKSPCSR